MMIRSPRMRKTHQNSTKRKRSLPMKTTLPGGSSPDHKGLNDRRGEACLAPTGTALLVENSIYHIAVLDGYPELLHGISTRMSPGGDDWNLSARRGTPQHPPSWDRALANREMFARRLGIR